MTLAAAESLNLSLINELKRRNVFKVGLAYLVTAWLVMQVADVVLNNVEAPGWVFHAIILLLGIGFPFALIFAWAFELTPDGLKREFEVDRTQSITHKTSRKLDFAIIGMLTLALGYFAYDKFVLDPRRDQALIEAASQAADAAGEVAAETEPSIAVLPFVNISSDPEQEYFADGISEEILNALARVQGLKVAGRTSSFAFKDKADDLNAIGQALRVDHILEGSVRKSGKQVRITAQLIEVESGFHLWSQAWDRELADIFVIQDEISRAILGELKAQLLGEFQDVAESDTQAYDLYLAAKQLIHTRNQASLERAAEMLRQAIAIDGGYASAHAQLGITTILLSERNYGGIPEADARPAALAHLERALELGPRDAEALAGMGLYYSNQSLDAQAVEWLNRAIAVNPNLVNANNWLANSLRALGRLREALRVAELNHARDPLHQPTFVNLADAYARMGQAAKALEMLRQLEPFLPSEPSIASAYGHAYWFRGDFAKALEQLRRSYELEPYNEVTQLWYGGIHSSLMNYDAAIEVATDFVKPIVLTRLGRFEEALMSANDIVGSGGYPMPYLEALVLSGQHERLIEEIETRWGGLGAFDTAWPDRDGNGADMLGWIAVSYRAMGDEQGFEAAMHRFRASLDAQLGEGADNWLIFLSQANYAALAGNVETALESIEQAVERGGAYDPVIDSERHFFRALRGEPRFEAARQGMIDNLNSQRKAAGLEPIQA